MVSPGQMLRFPNLRDTWMGADSHPLRTENGRRYCANPRGVPSWPRRTAGCGRSGLFGEDREPVERGPEPVRCGRPGSRKAIPIRQPGPVIGAGHPRACGAGWLKFPAPQVPGRPLPCLGGHPGKPAALFELNHMVLPDAALGELHRKDITRAPDALPGRCHGQVVVAVPVWLLSRIGDQLEDPPCPRRDLAAGADNA